MAVGQLKEGADRDAAVSAFWEDLHARLKEPMFRKAFLAAMNQILKEGNGQWSNSEEGTAR
jgi:GTPase SAR1 family protein